VRARRGLALAAVLAVLVILSMVVAMSAQRALLVARQGVLDLARADIAASVASAQAALLDEDAGSARVAGIGFGVPVASGVVTAGTAQAHWRLVGAAAPFATGEIESWAPVHVGVAREVLRALLTPRIDSAGVARWALVGGAGWVRVPLP